MSFSFLWLKLGMANIFQVLSKLKLQNLDSAGKNAYCFDSLYLPWIWDREAMPLMSEICHSWCMFLSSVKMQIILGRHSTFSLSQQFLLQCELFYYMDCKCKCQPRRKAGSIKEWRGKYGYSDGLESSWSFGEQPLLSFSQWYLYYFCKTKDQNSA